MKSNTQPLKKTILNSIAALCAGLIFLTGFFLVYNYEQTKDLKKIERYIEQAQYKYICFASTYQKRISKHKNKPVNLFILNLFEPILDQGIYVYFSNEMSFGSGKKSKRFIIQRSLANEMIEARMERIVPDLERFPV